MPKPGPLSIAEAKRIALIADDIELDVEAAARSYCADHREADYELTALVLAEGILMMVLVQLFDGGDRLHLLNTLVERLTPTLRDMRNQPAGGK